MTKESFLKDENIINEVSPLTLNDLWGIVLRGKLLILGSVLTIVLLGMTYISMATPKYRATSTILIQNNERNLQMESVTPTSVVNDLALIPSQIQVLVSRELMRRTLKDLGILSPDDAESKPADATDTKETPADDGKSGEVPASATLSIDSALNNLTVTQVEKSRAIDISYLSANPRLATAIVNTLMENYIAQQVEWRFNNVNQTNNWLRNRVQELQEDIRKGQNEVIEIRKKAGLVDSRGRDLIEQDISELSMKLTEARAVLSENESRLEEFKNGGNSAAPSVLASPLIQRLREREAAARDELSKLRGELGAAHPNIIAAQAQVSEINAQIQREVSKIASGIRSERDVAEANVQRLQASLDELKKEYNTAGEANVELQAVQNEVKTNQELLDTLSARLKQTQSQVDERLQEANAVVISKASVPAKPATPNIPLILFGCAVAGLGVGLALAIGRDQFEDTVFNGKQLQNFTKATNITLVPKIVSNPKGITDITEYPIKAPYSLYAESMRAISAYLRIHMEAEPESRFFNFTSAGSNEGKSTVIGSLARQMASEGMKVLVIDCDLRQPVITQIFGLKGKFGLTDLLNEDCTLAEAVNKDELSGAHIIGKGTLRDTNIISRGNPVWLEIKKKLLKMYDVVLLDSPPILSISDTKLLGSAVNNIVCVHWKKTPLRQIGFVMDTLKRLKCPLIGTVITYVDIKKSTVYNYMDAKYYLAPTKRRA